MKGRANSRLGKTNKSLGWFHNVLWQLDTAANATPPKSRMSTVLLNTFTPLMIKQILNHKREKKSGLYTKWTLGSLPPIHLSPNSGGMSHFFLWKFHLHSAQAQIQNSPSPLRQLNNQIHVLALLGSLRQWLFYSLSSKVPSTHRKHRKTWRKALVPNRKQMTKKV